MWDEPNRCSPPVRLKINLSDCVSLKAQFNESVHLLQPVDVVDLVAISTKLPEMSQAF